MYQPIQLKTKITSLGNSISQSLVAIITLLFAAMGSVQSAHAAIITVQSTGDGVANAGNCPGAGCRLRDALATAANGDTITFAVTTPATITLSNGQLDVNVSVTISGPGANLLTVDANHASRVFSINNFGVNSISGLTITNGTAADDGGGILNATTLTVSNCTISGNSAGIGGGIASIFQFGGPLTVTNCTLSGNSASDGGGIYNTYATLSVSNCTLSGNSASFGGGIFNVAGSGNNGDLPPTVTISNSTLSGNSASEGGGIFNGGDNSGGLSVALTISNSTLSGNSATTFGGAIENFSGDGIATVTISNSTLSGNSANSGGVDNDASGGAARP